ncbi:MAG: hypothetical protein IJ706_08930 [Clostridia bacterium]|nr:hypothetical protein [Clostridia bacterium]
MKNGFNDVAPENSKAGEQFNNIQPQSEKGELNDISVKGYEHEFNAPEKTDRAKKAKGVTTFAKIAAAVVAVAGAVTVGAISLDEFLPTDEDVVIEYEYLGDGTLSYSVEIRYGEKEWQNDFEPDKEWEEEKYSVVIYNDFEYREFPFGGYWYSDTAEGLKPEMYYKIAVKRDNSTLAEKTFKTEVTENGEKDDSTFN